MLSLATRCANKALQGWRRRAFRGEGWLEAYRHLAHRGTYRTPTDLPQKVFISVLCAVTLFLDRVYS